jgi:hypothetical protein
LTELVVSRDKFDFESVKLLNGNSSNASSDFRVIEEFLKLRRNKPNIADGLPFSKIDYSLTLPMTDFRTMVHGNRKTRSALSRVSMVSEVVTVVLFCLCSLSMRAVL